jgi:lipoate-protein ligase A
MGAKVDSWRFLDSGHANGVTNMAIDEAILESLIDGASPPTVRVYAWQPPTVSVGRSQRLARELDLEACRREGFGVVGRPTGGRAVLHAGELTYSVVGRVGVHPLGGSIAETYRAIADGLLAALAELGVAAALAPVATTSRGREDVAPPCFVSAGRFEVVVQGRKLIGSAQRRSGGCVLQHGSLLLDDSHVRLADVMSLGSREEREAVRGMLRAKTTDLSSLLGRPVGFEETARAVRSGFEGAWGMKLSSGALTERETDAALAVATDYRTDS